jgi:hypothetical protein
MPNDFELSGPPSILHSEPHPAWPDPAINDPARGVRSSEMLGGSALDRGSHLIKNFPERVLACELSVSEFQEVDSPNLDAFPTLPGAC